MTAHRLAGIALLVSLLCPPAVIAPASAQTVTTVRGRLERQTPQGQRYVAALLALALRDSTTRTMVARAYTGRDGVYYFHRVRPGPYVLEVAVPGSATSRKYRIRALPQAYTDIRPILIP